MTTWLDLMPEIPLTRGVPVLVLERGEPAIYLGPDPGNTRLMHLVWFTERRCSGSGPLDWLRVDLADPKGFGYALRWAENRLHQLRGEGMDRATWGAFERQIHGLVDDWFDEISKAAIGRLVDVVRAVQGG